MKKELLSEINRFREIVGLSLIRESIIPSSLLSNLETMLSPGGRNIEDFFRTGSGKVIDDVYEFVKKSAYGPGTTRDELATLVRQFLDGKLTESQSDVLLAAFLRSGDENITNLLYKGILDSDATIGSFMKKFEPGAKVKTGDGSVVNFEDVILSKNEAEIQEYLDKSKLIIDRSGVGDETKKYFKEKITTNIENIRGRGTETMGSKKQLTMDEIEAYYDDAKLQLGKEGKTLPPFSEIEKLSKTLVKQLDGKSPEEIVEFLKTRYSLTEQQLTEVLEKGANLTGRGFLGFNKYLASAIKEWVGKSGVISFTALFFGGIALYLGNAYLNKEKGIVSNKERLEALLGPDVVENLPDDLLQAMYMAIPNSDTRVLSGISLEKTSDSLYKINFLAKNDDGSSKYKPITFTKGPLGWLVEGNQSDTKTTKIYTQSLPGFQQYLKDNNIAEDSPVNNSENGFWTNGNVEYLFKVTDSSNGNGTWEKK